MQKTANYNLKKPEPTDPLRVADFNTNSDIIDAALNNLNTAMGQVTVPKIAVGSYVGTASGASGTVEVDVGFRPKAVIAWGVHSDTQKTNHPLYSAMAVDGTVYTRALEIADTGFTAKSSYSSLSGQYYPNLNSSGMTYLYFAVG